LRGCPSAVVVRRGTTIRDVNANVGYKSRGETLGRLRQRKRPRGNRLCSFLFYSFACFGFVIILGSKCDSGEDLFTKAKGVIAVVVYKGIVTVLRKIVPPER